MKDPALRPPVENVTLRKEAADAIRQLANRLSDQLGVELTTSQAVLYHFKNECPSITKGETA